jgi:hypothetical protein
MNFRIDPGFTDAARDQLRELRSEVNDEDSPTIMLGAQSGHLTSSSAIFVITPVLSLPVSDGKFDELNATGVQIQECGRWCAIHPTTTFARVNNESITARLHLL